MTAYLSKSITDRDMTFLNKLYSRFRLVISKFEVDLIDSLETMRFSEKLLSLLFFSNDLQSLAILFILMIVSKNHIEIYLTMFSFNLKKDLYSVKKGIISSE